MARRLPSAPGRCRLGARRPEGPLAAPRRSRELRPSAPSCRANRSLPSSPCREATCVNGESRPRTRARGCRGRAASPRGSVSVSAPPRPCSRPAGQRLQAPLPRPAGRPARPAAPACPARGPSGPATRTWMQAPASCLARAQGPRPGGSTRRGAVATGCRKPHGPAAAISEWWLHGPVAIGTPVLSPPAPRAGRGGAPSPAAGARRGLSAGVTQGGARPWGV